MLDQLSNLMKHSKYRGDFKRYFISTWNLFILYHVDKLFDTTDCILCST